MSKAAVHTPGRRKFKMANDANSSASGEEGHSDPLRLAADAGASLSSPAKAEISRERKVQTNPAEKSKTVCFFAQLPF